MNLRELTRTLASQAKSHKHLARGTGCAKPTVPAWNLAVRHRGVVEVQPHEATYAQQPEKGPILERNSRM